MFVHDLLRLTIDWVDFAASEVAGWDDTATGGDPARAQRLVDMILAAGVAGCFEGPVVRHAPPGPRQKAVGRKSSTGIRHLHDAFQTTVRMALAASKRPGDSAPPPNPASLTGPSCCIWALKLSAVR